MEVQQNLRNFKAQIPETITLIAVSKTKPSEAILQAYQAGQLDFGENRVQELTKKAEELPKDIRWHAIGHLQRNKVKYIAPFVYLIHSVDSLKLLKEINKEAHKNNRIINCLLQIHIATEESKHGFAFEQIQELLSNDVLQKLTNINITGLMGMATLTENESQIRKEFNTLSLYFSELANKKIESKNVNFEVLSMGMSGDYRIAIEEGSNMIRIGSAIFGKRN